ncbi:MAG TPA: hypothetical protein ENG48_03360 [Candidatus Atribacteria bacterium]|nr:hypothetical protein [Candidatus Atribacteria bacterium]
MAIINVYKDISTGINYCLLVKEDELTLWAEQVDDDIIDVEGFVIENPKNIEKIKKEYSFLETLKNIANYTDVDLVNETIFSASEFFIDNFKKLAIAEKKKSENIKKDKSQTNKERGN